MKALVIASLTATLAASAATFEARAETATVAVAAAEAAASPSDTDLDRPLAALIRAIRAARKPLPAFALDAAEAAYGMWQTYRNGQKVEEMRRNVEATLRLVDGIRRDLDAGRELDDTRYRLTREALDGYGSALAALAARFDDLERWARERLEAQSRQVDQARARSVANTAILRRPGCGYRGYWDREKRRCAHK